MLMYALWMVVGIVVIAAVFSARLTVRPGRARVWSTPRALGLEFEDIAFEAQDGVRLVGWFLPAPAGVARPAPVIIVVHGWPWCRMGTQAKNVINDLPGSRPVHLLPLMKQLHDQGYHVLTADSRNFGDSESRGVVTGGWLESRDVLGALDFLRKRTDVDMERIAAIGFSQGGATLMYALPQTDLIKAAIAVQPTTPSVFESNYARALMGPLAFIVAPLRCCIGSPVGLHWRPFSRDWRWPEPGRRSYSFREPAIAGAPRTTWHRWRRMHLGDRCSFPKRHIASKATHGCSSTRRSLWISFALT